MIELIKTSNPVRMSFLRAVLKDAGIETAVFDQGVGALYGGAVFTARLMVDVEGLAQARRVIADAERGRGEA
jgi:hypothetical protein